MKAMAAKAAAAGSAEEPQPERALEATGPALWWNPAAAAVRISPEPGADSALSEKVTEVLFTSKPTSREYLLLPNGEVRYGQRDGRISLTLLRLATWMWLPMAILAFLIWLNRPEDAGRAYTVGPFALALAPHLVRVGTDLKIKAFGRIEPDSAYGIEPEPNGAWVVSPPDRADLPLLGDPSVRSSALAAVSLPFLLVTSIALIPVAPTAGMLLVAASVLALFSSRSDLIYSLLSVPVLIYIMPMRLAARLGRWLRNLSRRTRHRSVTTSLIDDTAQPESSRWLG